MKKRISLLSLFLAMNGIVTSARADYTEEAKIVGGALAAATAVGYAIMIPDLKYIPVPAIVSATILSAMAFGLTKDITVNPAVKIVGGTAMALSAYLYACAWYYLNDPKDETILERQRGTIIAGPATVCTATLAALSFHSLLTDEKFIESLKYIFCS